MKAVFYDLDGTLLPMDMDVFTGTYFGQLAKKLEPYGYKKDELIKHVWAGTACMVKNDGSVSNEEAFWNYFCPAVGCKPEDKGLFTAFYENEFDEAKKVCGYNEFVPQLIKEVKALGLKQVLATNPIFPEIATRKRISWAGLSVEDFECFTTYENSSYAKPNTKYYEELLKKLSLDPTECIMIGNDVDEDMVARELGMKVFLVTDCVLNKHNKDINEYPHGDFKDALNYIKSCL